MSRIIEVYTARFSPSVLRVHHQPSAVSLIKSTSTKFHRSRNESTARPKASCGICEACFTSLFGTAVRTKSHLQPYSCKSVLIAVFRLPSLGSVWDVRTGRTTHTLAGHHGEISSTQFSYSSDLCISGSIDRTCKVRFALFWGTV